MDFKKGDANYHTFSLPASTFTPGGRLFFAAKPAFDDDSTDSTALIQGNWGDDVVTDITISGVAYKRWACVFPPSATNSIASSGASTRKLLGEFQWVSATGVPLTYPGYDKKKIPVTIYMDIKRKVTT